MVSVLKRCCDCVCFPRMLLVFITICIGIVACSPAEDDRVFSEPFELSGFLKNNVDKLPGQTVRFQVLSRLEEPIPYGLLSFQWVEGGRMSFQTDHDGILSMQFEQDILDYEVMVSPESTDTKLRVTW